MRLSIGTLKKIESEFGEFDISQVIGGSNDMYLRFGYWRQIDVEKLQNIIGVNNKIEEDCDFDDECGYQYMYRLLNNLF